MLVTIMGCRGLSREFAELISFDKELNICEGPSHQEHNKVSVSFFWDGRGPKAWSLLPGAGLGVL